MRSRRLITFLPLLGILLLGGCWNQEEIPIGSGPVAMDVDVPFTPDLPNFIGIIDIKQRKSKFIDFVRPFVLKENARILEQRERLLELSEHRTTGRAFSRVELDWIKALCREYRLGTCEPTAQTTWDELSLRVDVVPISLALAQAAAESGWGTSRFANEANNIFGQWCFSKDCGVVPADRPEGAIYEVARFDSINEAVRSYMRNLNTGTFYKDMRRTRQKMRERNEPITGYVLAEGLSRYSQGGEQYVGLIRNMIRNNMDLIDAP